MLRLQNFLKMSSRCICETSRRRFEDVLKTSWTRPEDVLKTSWRRFEDVLKTSSEDVWVIRIYSSSSRSLEDVFIKTNVCWVYLTPTAKNKSSVRPGYITLMCWMCSKLTMKTPEREREINWCCFGFIMINFDLIQISYWKYFDTMLNLNF